MFKLRVVQAEFGDCLILKLRVVQAEFGDCLILEFGTSRDPRYILVDGGPATVYERHLGPELRRIGESGGGLDLVVLSHVDNDHTIGLLDFLGELEEQRANSAPATIAVSALWHNSFSRTIGSGTDIEPRLRSMLAGAGSAAQVMASTDAAVAGIGEGNSLRRKTLTLGLELNKALVDADHADGVVRSPAWPAHAHRVRSRSSRPSAACAYGAAGERRRSSSSPG